MQGINLDVLNKIKHSDILLKIYVNLVSMSESNVVVISKNKLSKVLNLPYTSVCRGLSTLKVLGLIDIFYDKILIVNELNSSELLKNEQPTVNPILVSESQKEDGDKTNYMNCYFNKFDESNLHKLTETDRQIYGISKAFYDLFIKNADELGMKWVNLDNYTYSQFTKPIKLMLEKDLRRIEDLRKIHIFLQNSDFWKPNIRSTIKLRDKFDELLVQVINEQNMSLKKSYKQNNEKFKTKNSDDFVMKILNNLTS
jgi:hypothetical protein